MILRLGCLAKRPGQADSPARTPYGHCKDGKESIQKYIGGLKEACRGTP